MVWPSPTNHGECPANRCGLNHPGDRRAGCPHPAGPCGGANPRGRDKSLPYKPRRAHGQPGNRNLRVMINLCRGRCLHRPGDPAPPQGPAGGPWPSPTNHGGRLANRCGRNHPGDRRAGYPHPAGPRGGANACGRDKSLPYKPRRARGQPENHKPCFITNLCRGRCSHRPEGHRTAARSRGRAMALPYEPWRTPGQPVRPRPPGRP